MKKYRLNNEFPWDNLAILEYENPWGGEGFLLNLGF